MTDDQIHAAIAECREIAAVLHEEAAFEDDPAKSAAGLFIEEVCDFAGRIVQPGMVAVPVEDLRLAISNDGYDGAVPYFNALLRLHERLRAAGGQP